MRKNTINYRHNSHCLGLATVHLCWIPKRRKPILTGKIRSRLHEIIAQAATDKNWFVRSLEIAPDHVHLLVEYDNNHSIAEVVRTFKGRSSRYLRQEFPELLKLPSLWSRSYFYETTGKISTAKIKAYIEDPHHW
jgi:putative transposase